MELEIILGIVILGGLFLFIYKWILGTQTWFYHARRIMRDIQDKIQDKLDR